MKSNILFFIIFILMCSCRSIERIGYIKNDNTDTCNVHIYRGVENSGELISLGSVKISDFYRLTNQKDVYNILKKEACYCGANLVSIDNLNYPKDEEDYVTCEASLFKDSNNIAIGKYSEFKPQKRIYLSKFSFLPFNYIFLHINRAEVIQTNVHFWENLLLPYKIPASKNFGALIANGCSLIYDQYFLDISYGYSNNNTNFDSLKTILNSSKFNINFGINVLNKGITISPYLGFCYYYNNHIVSRKEDEVTLDNFLSYPDISISAHQLTSQIGLNFIIPVHNSQLISINFGYNMNLHNYPYLNSSYNSIKNVNMILTKNFVFSMSWGFGISVGNNNFEKYKFEDFE